MCDTLVIKNSGRTFFAKNSDREPVEAQLVVRKPPVTNDRRKKCRATYREIDQTADRHGVVLSKPFWMWGAEMGANDRGVVIGNEAVFTRLIEKSPGLIGMDLLRLGLERGDTAEHALKVITELLEKYGQGGVCGFLDKKLRYDNSFIIADAEQAWILETAGRHWAARKVKEYGAISNCLTIGADYDLHSKGLQDFARQKKLYSGKGAFSFSSAFDTRLIPFFAAADHRLKTSRDRLEKLGQKDGLAVADMADLLRRHHKADIAPRSGSNADICMHAADPVVRRNQTCGAMVSRLDARGSLHFFTGTSAPCLSVFKPAHPDMDHDFYVLNPDESSVDGSLWQRFEAIHRRLLFKKEKRRAIRASIANTENEMFTLLTRPETSAGSDPFRAADRRVAEWTEDWILEMRKAAFAPPMFRPYGWFWRRMNRLDKCA